MPDSLRRLPALHVLLGRRAVRGLLRSWSREFVRSVAREVLEEERAELRAGVASGSEADLLRASEARLLSRVQDLSRPRLRRVINATGVLLHTNLGRARMSAATASEMERVAAEPVELEVDLGSNRRGGRSSGAEQWLRRLTGAADAAVVNNGAAALYLAVRATVARGRKLVISRGEQVAIGGSFRMPELVRSTGAKMVEVGTTNRTTIQDYAKEVSAGDVVLKVHPSNYRIEGFACEVPLAELAGLCRERDAVLIHDAGSGCLIDFSRFGLKGEPTLAQLLSDGPSLVTCSGDKLLGGPQAGLVLGRPELVRGIRRHPVMRALRADKTMLAALEATLKTYAHTPSGSLPDLPLFTALSTRVGELQRRARQLVAALSKEAGTQSGWKIAAVRSTATMGAGSFSSGSIPSFALRLIAPDRRAAAGLHRALRIAEPAVLARIDDEAITVDLRAVAEAELAGLESALLRGFRVTAGSEPVREEI